MILQFLELPLVDVCEFFEPLGGEFFPFKGSLSEVLLVDFVQGLCFSQQLILVSPQVTESSFVLNLHQSDFLFILKFQMVNFIFQQLVLLQKPSMTHRVIYFVVFKQSL